jgi:diaminopimelate decarboxylase
VRTGGRGSKFGIDRVELSELRALAQQHGVTIVGPICESGDTLGVDRRLPVCHEGDVLLIDTVGAYGFAMASRYNLRELPEQVLLVESGA